MSALEEAWGSSSRDWAVRALAEILVACEVEGLLIRRSLSAALDVERNLLDRAEGLEDAVDPRPSGGTTQCQ